MTLEQVIRFILRETAGNTPKEGFIAIRSDCVLLGLDKVKMSNNETVYRSNRSRSDIVLATPQLCHVFARDMGTGRYHHTEYINEVYIAPRSEPGMDIGLLFIEEEPS